MTEGKSTWRFPRAFWTGNVAELFERAAYYGTFIVIQRYLSEIVGLGDVRGGVVGALFAGLIYLLPFFTGAAADRMGFRNALMLAFALLTVGYGTLGVYHTAGPVVVGLALIVLGGAFVKPVITGTVSKTSDATNRARAFSIFYMVVNIGAFTGKTVVAPMRIQMGVDTVPFFSAGASLFALILVMLIYRPPDGGEAQPTTVRETLHGMWMAMSNLRFGALVLITAGFWMIQGQLYASMPAYVVRMAGDEFKPEWYANVNPLVVVLLVVPITQMIREWKPQHAMLIAMALIPMSSLAMASEAAFRGNLEILGLSIHTITAMMAIGIAIQGLAECFLSPKWLEFASKQAPAGKEGTFLGFAHLNTFIAWTSGFVLGGVLLARYCPDPKTLPDAIKTQHADWLVGNAPMPDVYAHAHYLWYTFAGVGLTSLLALLGFVWVTGRIDARKAADPTG
jgi:dipeptide/tripeptide permease